MKLSFYGVSQTIAFFRLSHFHSHLSYPWHPIVLGVLREDSRRLRWKSSVWKRCRGILHCFNDLNGVWTDFDPFWWVLPLMEEIRLPAETLWRMRYSSNQLVSRISSIICILEEFWRTNLLYNTCFCVMVFCWDLQGESTSEYWNEQPFRRIVHVSSRWVGHL